MGLELTRLDLEGVLGVVRIADGRLGRQHGVMAVAVDGDEGKSDDRAAELLSGFFGAIFVGLMWLLDLATSKKM